MTQGNDDGKRKKANLRLALILVSIVAVFFFGFMAKMVLLGR
ncbi:MAG TPA: cytochrome oxidase small assembly protein [Ramlibacter sp.]|nr:cytochrome oxidase small assembly protein [Ramlibacter sp.]